MLDTLKIYEQLKEDITPQAAKKIAEAIGQVYTELLNTPSKDDFNTLKDTIAELAEAQKQSEHRLTRLETNIEKLINAQNLTEQRLNELAKAQQKTEQRLNEFEKSTQENFDKVWGAINNLTRAQQKTEQRVNELTEAQKKTEQRLNELAKAQQKTEQRLNEFEKSTQENFDKVWGAINNLTRAQQKTEQELKTLVQEHKKTREMVAGLSDTVGYGLEDKIFPYMVDFAKKEYNIDVKKLDRKNIVYTDGKHDEVNIYVEGKKGKKKAYLIGECKSRPGKKDISKFSRLLDRLKKHLDGEVFGFIVGYYYPPEVEEYLGSKHPEIRKMKSFEFELYYTKKSPSK